MGPHDADGLGERVKMLLQKNGMDDIGQALWAVPAIMGQALYAGLSITFRETVEKKVISSDLFKKMFDGSGILPSPPDEGGCHEFPLWP